MSVFFTLLLACFGAGCVRRPVRAELSAERRSATTPPDVEVLLAQMTLDEKVGQMTQVDRLALRDGSEIRDFFLGSVLSGGHSLPSPNEPETWAEMYDGYQTFARSTRLAIPIFYGIDAVHGHGSVKGAVIFPHHIGLGATRDPDLVEQIGRVTAREVAGTGIDWTFSPCIAVPRDERWGRTYEGFGETPELAAMMGAAEVRGLEGAGLSLPERAASVMACAKHFVADGATLGGKDQGDARISEEELLRLHLPGYQAAIAAGVGSIMVSYSSWNGLPMHANRHLITDVLKGRLGFSGFVVTDWQAIDKLPGDYASAVATAINAGIDMVMVPIRYRSFIAALRAEVTAGRVPLSRIDDAVRRILRQKVRFGLWDHPLTDRALTAEIGGAAHRALARKAVRESLVLLKNDNVLPLQKTARVHVMGSKADDIGMLCGGWSVGWNGGRGPRTPGTSIRAGIEQVAAGRVTDGEGGADADVVVIAIGEEPYAEGRGDRRDLNLLAEDRQLVAEAKKKGKPLIVILLSGRPLILGEVLALADALVVAWLPGTEGGGVADVLFGDAPFRGKLSHSWPRTMEQIPINVGDEPYDPLFAYGFGLEYGANAPKE
jgi:beta-glucosidase